MSESKIPFHFEINDDFKTVLATGVFGGLTPNGLINMNFFLERANIPDTIIYQLSEDGRTAEKEVSVEGGEGIVREVFFGVVIDVNTANDLVNWLNERIKMVESNFNKNE